MRTKPGHILAALLIVAMLPQPAMADETLQQGFENPPQQARPQVWWHWMGGNVTSEGAALDLEWMKRVGIGGVHVFSGEIRSPKVLSEPAPFMSPKWQEVFRQSLQTARAAGMEVTIAGSPGWSQTGGPWVTPADAMKKYVWSETVIQGRAPYVGELPKPPTSTGPILGAAAAPSKGESKRHPELYGDSLVVAFPTPRADLEASAPVYSVSSGRLDLSRIAAGNLDQAVKLPIAPGTNSVSIHAEYQRPTRIHALTLGLLGPIVSGIEVQASDDGRSFRKLLRTAPRAINTIDFPGPQRTYALTPTTARFFRIVLTAPPVPEPLPGTPSAFPRGKPATEFSLAAIKLHTSPRIDQFEAKAGFEPSIDPAEPQQPVTQGAAIRKDLIIDLTNRLTDDGKLSWTPPPGSWTVLRFGWSLTGHENGPAETQATGLEVDKLDSAAVRRYVGAYLELYSKATGGQLGKNGIQNLLTDSWEAGVQNWTPRLPQEFRSRRGYDLLPFLPVLTGRVVESVDVSERFLWDLRQTLKELVADNHHGVIAKELHGRGMGYYSEATGDTPRAIADGLSLKARADIPTAEYWYRPFATAPGQPSLKADMREAASAAHLYGKPLVATEALTVAAGNDPWSFSPAMLKPVADEIFAHGVNRILIHESHLQPFVDKKPGLAMAIFGQYFNRNETWAEYAKPWIDYLARTSYMLQQGRPVADVAYYYGEERNLTELFRSDFNTDVPAGYGFDYVNSEALLALFSVKDGRLVTPSGMAYRVLYIPRHVTRYTVPTLRKLSELVAAGAVVVGPKPVGGLGLGSPDREVLKIADQIWGPGAGSASGHRFGAGRAFATVDLVTALREAGVSPDVTFDGASGDANLLSLHRTSGDADIYFISNQQPRSEEFQARFRVNGKTPFLWRAGSGERERLSYRLKNDRVEVPMRLHPHEAVFVVFEGKASQPEWTAANIQEKTLATLSGPWPVRFEAGRGAPPSATFAQLASWHTSDDAGVRFFSGAGTYSRSIEVPSKWLAKGNRVLLDLGEVHVLAVVHVNGQRAGTAWHAPYRIDITDQLRPGRNMVEIRVVNLWPNRLIGDKQPGAKPITFAPESTYTAESPLLPSGLLGPVSLIGATEEISASERTASD